MLQGPSIYVALCCKAHLSMWPYVARPIYVCGLMLQGPSMCVALCCKAHLCGVCAAAIRCAHSFVMLVSGEEQRSSNSCIGMIEDQPSAQLAACTMQLQLATRRCLCPGT
jgi:hypothetical protein